MQQTNHRMIVRNSVITGIMILSLLFAGEKSNLAGHYTGQGKIIVSWCSQDSLAMDIIIDNEGRVTGQIGDAVISAGQVVNNTFGPKKYLIKARLDGSIIKPENIFRESIKIPFDSVADSLIGGFGTSGSKIGGKENMVLSGANLVLVKKQLQ